MVSTWTMKHKVACRGFSSPRKYGEKLQLPNTQNTRLLHSSLSCWRVYRSLYLDRASYKRSIKEPVGFKNKRHCYSLYMQLAFWLQSKKRKGYTRRSLCGMFADGGSIPPDSTELWIMLRLYGQQGVEGSLICKS